MNEQYRDKIHRVNCLTNDLDAIYHQAALKLGISDSAMFVLYMIHDKGDNCLLYDICRDSGISKQTINSAVRKLETDGILYLEQDKGRTKRVCLTQKGKHYMDRTVVRLFEAECNAFRDWTADEIDLYLRLLEKYNDSFRVQIEKM
ncbi:MAG: MarR family transcriptional regulator [Oscillospiraceae bacterium]|nr:MarR family transcriptional regulator [Oscillospiraceae bacterium]